MQIGRVTVGDYLNRFVASGLAWSTALSEAELERPPPSPAPGVPSEQRPPPDWVWVHAELRRPGVSLALLWKEYRLSQPQGLHRAYNTFGFESIAGPLPGQGRQDGRGDESGASRRREAVRRLHRADGAGDQPCQSSEIRQAQVFVAALGASSYTFAEATWSQQLPDWLGSHARCIAFPARVSEIVVPDNLRSAESKVHRYEPDINPSYRDLAGQYGVAEVPARVRKPRDKTKAEVVERWILAVNRQFFSLDELSTAIAVLLERLSQRPFRNLPGSRQSAFEALDRRPCARCRSSPTPMPSGRRPGHLRLTMPPLRRARPDGRGRRVGVSVESADRRHPVVEITHQGGPRFE